MTQLEFSEFQRRPEGGETSRFERVGLTLAVCAALILSAAWVTGFAPHRGQPLIDRPHAAPALAVAASRPATPPQAPPVPASTVPPPLSLNALTAEMAEQSNAVIPISTLPNPPAMAFHLPAASATDRARAQTCLAMAVYYEAASEGPRGEAAVAQVVLNRVRNPLFPKTVCGVVFDGSSLPTGCQFTFTCDGSLSRPPDPVGWKSANAAAAKALNGYVEPEVGEATHYHTMWVAPVWRLELVKVAQVGAHIFYRWNGPLGLPAAFRLRYAGAEPAPPLPAGPSAAPAAIYTATEASAVASPSADRPAAAVSLAVIDQQAPAGTAPPPVQNAANPGPLRVASATLASGQQFAAKIEVMDFSAPPTNSESNPRLPIPNSW